MSSPADDVGSAGCAGCHASQYNSWLDTPHARSASLGCENCHGPGSAHRRRPTSANVQKDPSVGFCLDCHSAQHSAGFQDRYAEKKLRVHPSPGQSEERWTTLFAQYLKEHTPVEMELFIMSDCPYGIEAEAVLIPLALEFPEQIHLQLTYLVDTATLAVLSGATAPVGFSDSAQTTPGCLPGPLQPSHVGRLEPSRQSTLEEQMRQVLLREYAPERFLDYVLTRLQTPAKVSGWDVARSVGIDPTLIELELQAGEGLRLLQQDAERSERLGIYASPTLLINGREYAASLSSTALTRQWCHALGVAHPFCDGLPKCQSDLDCDSPREFCADAGSANARCVERPLIPITLTILDGLDCRSCFSDLVIASSRQLFAGLTVDWLDVDSPRGSQLARKHTLERIPAYIFNHSIEQSGSVFEELKPILRKTPEGYLIAPELLETPFLWQRPRQPGRLELWFHPGEPHSDLAEAWWAKWVSSPSLPPFTEGSPFPPLTRGAGGISLPTTPEVHYIIANPTPFLDPQFSLQPGSDESSLILAPRLSEEQLDLCRRYALWQLNPGQLAGVLLDATPVFAPSGSSQDWARKVFTEAPETFRKDIRLYAEQPFVEPSGGALVHNQVWIAGWQAGTIPRILFEWGENFTHEEPQHRKPPERSEEEG